MVHEPLAWLVLWVFLGVPWCINLVTWWRWVHESCGDGTLVWRRRALAVGIAANSGILFTWTASLALALILGPLFDPWGVSADVALALLAASVILTFVGDGARSRPLLMLANVVAFLMLAASVPAVL